MTDSRFDECMLRMQHGEKEPLREIYQDYNSFIFSAAYSVTKSRENAEDLTADFFIKLWEQADKYRSGTGHKAWMGRIIHNMSIDFLRKYRRETLTEEMDEASEEEAASSSRYSVYDNSVESPVETEVLSGMLIQQAMEELSEEEREVLSMKIIGDMTFKTISEALGVSMGTVTWRYQSALKKLRKLGYE